MVVFARRAVAGRVLADRPASGPRFRGETGASLDPFGSLPTSPPAVHREAHVLETDGTSSSGPWASSAAASFGTSRCAARTGGASPSSASPGRASRTLAREYHRGPALVDLRLLKSQVRRLKDLALEASPHRGEEDGCRVTKEGIERGQGGGTS